MLSPLGCDLYLTTLEQARLVVGGVEYFGRPDLTDDLQRRLLEASLAPEDYGKVLFGALFRPDDDLTSGYRIGLARARESDRRLHVRLHLDENAPASLYHLAWEQLFDPREGLALSRARQTTLARHTASPLPALGAIDGRPRLLVAVPNPVGLSSYGLAEVAVDHTRRQIEEALRPLQGVVDWTFFEGRVTPQGLYHELATGGYHLVHVQAHGVVNTGGTEASLVLETDTGEVELVEEDRLSEIFEGERKLRLVTLIACQSAVVTTGRLFGGIARALVRRGCPAVIAMRRSIEMSTAATFMRAFYAHLAATGQVDVAVNNARQEMYLSDRQSADWSVPALHMRLVDGVLWPVRAAAPAARADTGFPWDAVLQQVASGNVVPVLGPGLNRGLIPTAHEVAGRWALKYHGVQADLPRVAQIVETLSLRRSPHGELFEIYKRDLRERRDAAQRSADADEIAPLFEMVGRRHFELDGETAHARLAQLPAKLYVTANYDPLLSVALRWAAKPPHVRPCAWREPREPKGYGQIAAEQKSPFVFHLFGNEPASMVLTEDDFLEFLRNTSKDRWRIPDRLVRLCGQSTLLFLGFDVRDLAFRVLFQTLVYRDRELSGGARVAVMQVHGDSDEAEVADELRHLETFITKYCDEMKFTVFWGSARSFLGELHERMHSGEKALARTGG